MSATLVLVAAALAPRAEAQDYTAPPGFAVEPVCELAQSLIAMTFVPETPGVASRRVFLAVEDGPILWADDRDGDGVFEAHGTFTDELANANGLVWHDGALFAVARHNEEAGIYRLTPSKDGLGAQRVELVAPIKGSGEHGAHGIVAGPDGYLYVAIGNEGALGTSPHASSPLLQGYEGSLLPPLYDPNGFNVFCRYPEGVIARVDPRNGSWVYHSVGYRNHYDLAFDDRGELFTCDSDMEWDIGLPWYRPVRVLHCVSGGDYGARAGSSMWPSYYPDTLPEAAVVGRGSPTGVTFYRGKTFPERYRGALLVGDWSRDQILCVRLTPKGASYRGQIETLVEFRASAGITDLEVGPGDALYFTSGGRGALGELRRLVYRAPPEVIVAPGPPAAPADAATPASAEPPKFTPIEAPASECDETATGDAKPSDAAPEAKPTTTSDAKPSTTPDAKPSTTPDAKPSTTPGTTAPPETKPTPSPETKSSAPSDAKPSATPETKSNATPDAKPNTPPEPNASTPSDTKPSTPTSAASPSATPPREVKPADAPAIDAVPKDAAPIEPAPPPVPPVPMALIPIGTAGAFPPGAPKPKVEPRPGRRATLDVLTDWLADDDARLQRLACEQLVDLATLEPPIRQRLYFLLGSADPFVRHAARSALERTAAKDLAARLDNERDPQRLLETVLLLARARVRDVTATMVAPHVAKLLRSPWASEHRAQILRVLEVVLLTLGEPDDAWRGRLVHALEEHFPGADRPAARESATLIAHWNPAGAVDRLLAALEVEPDHEQAIHYAFCLCSIREPWSIDGARKLLSWFDASSRWTGGASFDGYLDAMRVRVLPHFDAKIRSAIAREGKLGAIALAALVAGSAPDAQGDPGLEHDSHDVQSEILRALQAAYARLGDDAPGLASRKTVLQTIALSRLDGVANWLASIAESKSPERDVALIALARRHRLRDQPLFVKSLARTELEVPEACAQALIAIDAKPDDADTWAHVLDAARKLGVPRGWSVLQVAAHWLDKPALQPKTENWAHTLQQYDVWFSAKFPSYVRAARPEAERPSWDYEHVLAFLEKSSARAGSRGRGAQVFQQAACASCHVVCASDPTQNVISTPQAAGAQWGPDLTTVGRRFSVAQLLESIQFPSRHISDQYRTSVAETTDERRVEGRIVAQDEQSITLLSSDGARNALQQSEIRQIEPSSVSPMPEGLLDALTLEEIKDLFAFLRSDDRIDEADATSPPWTPLFSGSSQRTNWTYDADNWRLQSDVLIGRADNLPQSSYVVSKTSYRDFEIEFDVYMQNGNSGFQYRSAIDRSKPDPVGYQADIGQDYWGSLYASDGRGMIAEADPKVWRAAVDLLGWNHFLVRVVGDRHVIEINGVTTVDARDGEHKAGIIGFQLHEGMKMEVRFANMRFHSLRSR